METVEKPQYVLTEARLRACRANLEKARAAPRAVRARMTEKRLAACRANLEKARLAPRKRRPAGLRHSIEASLAAAGERLEDFHEHWRRFLRVFCPGKESESRLVRGMAEAAWRRLRVFRWQAQRETRALARVLSGLAGRATDHPLAPSLARREVDGAARDPSPGSPSSPPSPPGRGEGILCDRGSPPSPQGRGQIPSSGRQSNHPLAPSLARRGAENSASETGRQKEPLTRPWWATLSPRERAEECGAASPDHPLAPSLARRGAGVGTEERSRDIQTRLPGKEEGVRARVVVLGVLEVLRRSAGMWRRVYRLNRRMACLVRLVLILKQVNPEALNQWRIGPKTEERVFLLPDRLLGNPFVSRGPRGGSRNERAAGCGRVRSDRGPEFVARKAPEIRSEAELRELFQQALGALDSEERELVGRLAGTAWRRLELFRERAKREAEELARLLEAVAGESSACGSSPSEEGGQGTQSVPRPSEQKTGEDAGVAAGREPGKRRLLWLTEKERLKGAAVGMLRVFGEEWETQEAACELERELVGLLGEWVGRREAKVRVGMEGAA